MLDIMLPGEDGLEILKKLKCSSKTKSIPVIMVTAKGSEYDKVIGLDSGAGRLCDKTVWDDGACFPHQGGSSQKQRIAGKGKSGNTRSSY